jgi:hypothetical protein
LVFVFSIDLLSMWINLDIDCTDMESSFFRIAGELMNNWMLVANGNTYRLVEVEFYVQPQESSLQTGRRELNNKAGTWHIGKEGLEIIFETEKGYGGIQVRALQCLTEPAKYVYGPIKCFTELAGNTGFMSQGEVSLRLEKDTYTLMPFEEPIAVQSMANLSSLPQQAMGAKRYKYLLLPVLVYAGKKMAAVLKTPEQ